MQTGFDDFLTLEVNDLHVDVLTGIYSEETHLPQPLRISIRARLRIADHYEAETPLAASKNYMDLKHAASTALPEGVHFTLIEAVADHIIDTIFLQDDKVSHVEVKIVKLALSDRDPERSLLKVGEHRKHGKAPFAGRQN
ncbi:dihydroneopterin aldolase [Sphingobium sp. Leaf26]|uniref:dihydroneopterin aldolase n=1 Tax=Sphingobium sp. Leaf26 TaxID=1735693 RepID=UPI0006FA9019|nr:dihydroneopterin aldolase [Sphingobium sp. Leaf26]KQM97091.1 dihydroneopterin aldolase [Sphingobium sp. Leaf26]